METERPPLPPFTTVEAAVQKVRLASGSHRANDGFGSNSVAQSRPRKDRCRRD